MKVPTRIILMLTVFSVIQTKTALHNQTNSKLNKQPENTTEPVDSHGIQVFPVGKVKLTSSVLPAAIQMITFYEEKLEELQKEEANINTSHHHHTFTSSPGDYNENNSTAKPQYLNTTTENIQNTLTSKPQYNNTTNEIHHNILTTAKPLNNNSATEYQNNTPITTTAETSSTTKINENTPTTKPEQILQTTTTVEEETEIPDELHEQSTTDIPTEGYTTIVTTESSENTTNIYEININEEIVVDIDLMLGKNHKERNEGNINKTGKQIEQYNEYHSTLKTGNIDRKIKPINDDMDANKLYNIIATPKAHTRTGKQLKHNVLQNKINNKGHYNKTLNQRINNNVKNNSELDTNKNGNIVKNKLQNIITTQKNKINTKLNNVRVETVSNNSQTIDQQISNDINNQIIRSDKKSNKIEENILHNHMKQSYYNKTSDEIFMKTINEILREHQNLKHNIKNDDETKNTNEINDANEQFVNKFWQLADFFNTLQSLLLGDSGSALTNLLHHATKPIEKKEQETPIGIVKKELGYLKMLLKVEADNTNMWKYNGYSKSATKFIKSTSTLSSMEQLKITLMRLIERKNIKHEKTIKATQKVIDQLNDSGSNITVTLKRIPTLIYS